MTSKPVRLPLPPAEAISELFKVRPTPEMPRPGARKGAKKKAAKAEKP